MEIFMSIILCLCIVYHAYECKQIHDQKRICAFNKSNQENQKIIHIGPLSNQYVLLVDDEQRLLELSTEKIGCRDFCCYCIVSVLQFTLILNKIVDSLLNIDHSEAFLYQKNYILIFLLAMYLNFPKDSCLVNTTAHFKSALRPQEVSF